MKKRYQLQVHYQKINLLFITFEMNKSQLAYLSGIAFVSIGLIPIARSIFSIELFKDATVYFIAGGIWFLLIIVFLYSSKESQRQYPTRGNS